MKTCRQCETPIVGRTRRAMFCSYHCKEQWHLDKARDAVTQRLAGRTCRICGAPIASRSGKALCCSKACSVRLQNRIKDEARAVAWEAKKQPCPQCGTDIPPDRRRGSVYCSPKCKRDALSARWRERAPGYMRRYLYGITPEQFAERLAAQDGRCAICRTETPGGKGGWHVDHDHATKAIRGLLCHACNVALGNFSDDPARLRSAVAYLETRLS